MLIPPAVPRLDLCLVLAPYLKRWRRGFVSRPSFLSFPFSLQKGKVYVQHRLLEQKKLVWELLMDNAFIYVCGCVPLAGFEFRFRICFSDKCSP